MMIVCVLRYYWGSSPWSDCSRTCGSSFQYRSIFCLNENTARKANFAKCQSLTRPTTSRTCIKPSCDVSLGDWSIGQWSACSKTCGVGKQTRLVSCNFDTCRGQKPISTRLCNIAACTIGDWSIGQWSACSKTCGVGKQTRLVSCNFDTCQGQKPISTRLCNIAACTTGEFL